MNSSWAWLIFVVIGMILVVLELLIGVGTGLDLVFIGSAFIIGGLVSLPFNSWIVALVVTCVICIVYFFIGRRYVHRWTLTGPSKTNIDAIIGRQGIVLQTITRTGSGIVRIGNEQWRAVAAEDIAEGQEVIVKGIKGVTLTVEKT